MSNTIFIGKNFIELAHIPSTNTYALELLNVLPAEGTVVRAIAQTRGRGQAGNTWSAERGKNLTVSIILYPRFLNSKTLFYLSKMTSIAVRNCVAHFLPHEKISIKWPNDILIGRKKVAGILIENQFESKYVKASVIGIGLNINQQLFPDEISNSACAIRQYLNADLNLENVWEYLFSELERVYLNLRNGKKAYIDQQYFQYLFGYQKKVLLRVDDNIYEKMIVGVNTNGKLAVEWQPNKLRYFDIKEIGFVL